jgi:hypothetical protein
VRAAVGLFAADLFVLRATFRALFAPARLAPFFAAPRFAVAPRRAGTALALAAFRAFFRPFTERALAERPEPVRDARFALRFALLRLVALRVDLLFAMANPFRLKSRVPTIYLDSADLLP